MATEAFEDQLSRVEQMVDDTGVTWDLSDNDKAALKALLESHRHLVRVSAAGFIESESAKEMDRLARQMQHAADRLTKWCDSDDCDAIELVMSVRDELLLSIALQRK